MNAISLTPSPNGQTPPPLERGNLPTYLAIEVLSYPSLTRRRTSGSPL